METTKITFIGAGNMASSIIGGLIQHGWLNQNIVVADCDQNKLEQMHQQYQVQTNANNREAVANAHVIILAVKPQFMRSVTEEITDQVQQNQPLIISIAAGIQTGHIQNWLGDCSIIRTMPNTPALVQTGATGLYANAAVTDTQKQIADTILGAVGMTAWVDSESDLDLVTALSGSGPAYFFLFMEAMENAAQALGLNPDVAHQLTLQTALGSAKMAATSDNDLPILRKNVTSPGGTTEKAILSFENSQLRQTVHTAVEAAFNRSIELSQQFGDEK
ncbi:MAG: pyrroline-5-carboxylate reductase [Methylococcales bacterium]|jgi:pyrroline-5-carboxylate reductase|nr:pyrroline-5-carboxylate reductase [Methylococcales bacterium]MBT7444598.1 pyrroline-5-carboxylate reductase [Methylococcales bacterium]